MSYWGHIKFHRIKSENSNVLNTTPNNDIECCIKIFNILMQLCNVRPLTLPQTQSVIKRVQENSRLKNQKRTSNLDHVVSIM